jgi:phosphatidylglycerophosphate synthase
MGAMTTFAEAPRELGVTGSVEKRILLWLAARVPARIGSDHLTALGFAATLAGAVFYALSARHPVLLLLVNGSLVLNWLGDSLDGTLARHRKQSRPRYGFYVDHLVDSIGIAALAAGFAWSGLMAPVVAAALLVAYLLMSIEVYLATYTVGNFKIAYAGVGGTELRLILASLNVAAYAWPDGIAGVGVFQVAGVLAALGLAAVVAISAIGNATRLRAEESAALRGR